MDDLSGFLHDLPAFGFGFMLVLARVGTTLLTGPGLGDAEIPPPVRIAMAAVLAMLVFPVMRGSLPAPPETVARLVGLIGLEVLVGAWMGFMTRVLVMAMAIAGSIMSLMIGLSSVLQIDPSLGIQVTALQRLFSLASVVLVLASGLYILPIQAIIGSYELIPPGSTFDAGGAAQLVTRVIAESFGLALRLSAPFVVTAMVWQAAMGLVSRLVPNMQVHVISAPAQILSGLVLLSVAMVTIFANWSSGVLKAFSALPGL